MQHSGLCRAELDRLIEQRLVRDDPAGLDPADAETISLRPGVVDTRGELTRREAAEHHRVNRADARAGEHRNHRFRHHRHVNNDAIALADAEVAQRRRRARHLVAQLAIAVARASRR